MPFVDAAGLVASYGHQTLPAILHDHLSDLADEVPPPTRLAVRRAADDAFRVAPSESGVTRLRSETMWATVSVQRYLRLRPALGALLVTQVAIGALAIVASVVLATLGHPLILLLLLAPAVLASAWSRNADVVVAASYLGALYALLIVSAALPSGIEYLIALVAFLLGGRRGAALRHAPTLRRG